MRQLEIVAATLAALVLAGPVSAEPAVPNALICEFQEVASTRLEPAGGHSTDTPSPKPFGFTIAAIDFQAGTAQLIGNAGTSKLRVGRNAAGGLNFLEVTEGGNLMLTSTFLREGDSVVGAVHSRHPFMSAGIAFPSQYIGTCEVR